jgi:two-component system, NtrC family, sensor kinase
MWIKVYHMETNKKILVVDDQQDLRDQLAKLLLRSGKKDETTSLVQQMRERLMGNKVESKEQEDAPADSYSVDTAAQGEDAYEMVQKSIDEKDPYAVMFLDMRMPPGWDGLETAKKIRSIDKDIEIVIMTAYADHDQNTIAEQVGSPQKLLYIKKPFQAEEIYQLALSLTSKWSFENMEKIRKKWLEILIRSITKVKSVNANDIQKVYTTALQAIHTFTAAEKGFLTVWNSDSDEWDVSHHIGMELAEVKEYINQYRDKLIESRTTQGIQGNYILPLKREGFSAVAVVYDIKTHNDPEWFQLLNLLIMTTSEVISSASLICDILEKERLSAVGTAISKISHESKNSLNNILSHSQLLKEKAENDESMTMQVDNIITASENMLTQMNNVLTFSSDKELETKNKTKIADVLTDSCDSFKFLNKNREIELSIEGDKEIELNLSHAHISAAINNLLNNSLEAQAEGSKLSAKFIIKADGKKAKVTYQDNGPGVPEDIKESLFDPFVTSGKENGFGLGLPIVKQYMIKHSGTISLDNSYNDGASFIMEFPFLQQ